MGVPILEQGDILIASIQDALTDSELLVLRNELVRSSASVEPRAS